MVSTPPGRRVPDAGPTTDAPGGAGLVVKLGLAIALGGAGIAYVWSALNALLLGTATPARIVVALIVLLLIGLLVRWLWGYLSRLASRA